MNEADLILGPKKHVEMPTAQPTHFGRYPDVQDLCDTFLTEMEWHHDLYTIQQVVAGARDFKSPRSCITAAREMRSPEVDTQKYLKGVDDE